MKVVVTDVRKVILYDICHVRRYALRVMAG